MSHTRAGRTALGAAASAGVRHMAHRFIVGETPHKAARALRSLWDEGMAASLDLLGEATVTQAEADRYAERCAHALDTKAESVRGWPEQPLLEADSIGPLPRVNVCVKVSALTPLLRPEAPERGREDAAQRLRPLLRRAREHGAHLHIDMESLDTVEATLDLVFELLDEDEFARRAVGGRGAAGLPARVAAAARAAARVGALARAGRRRWCGWSRAPTGTTR